MAEIEIPSVKDFYDPVLRALHDLGGEGSNEAIDTAIIESFKLSPEQVAKTYGSPNSRNKPICADRIGWASSHLKIAGLIEQPRRKVWQLTAQGRVTQTVAKSVVRQAMNESKIKRAKEQAAIVQELPPQQSHLSAVSLEDLLATYTSWRDQLLEQLHEMTVSQLERFFLRIFKSEGIDTVDVLGTIGSAEIEGTMTSEGFLTFRVAFQFMRGNRQVSAREVEDFRRRARVSGSDKGLLITTGTFTQEATRESERRSPPKIELIDGKQLIDKLKELGLGVSTKRVVVEQVDIDLDWFRGI